MAIETIQRCTICGQQVSKLGPCNGKEYTVQIPEHKGVAACELTICHAMTHRRADGKRWYRVIHKETVPVPATPKK